MRNIIAGLILLAGIASADESVKINKFTIVSGGAVDMTVLVSLTSTGGRAPALWITHLNGKALTPAEVAKTGKWVAAADVAATLAILDNKAVLASEVAITSPFTAGGWWSDLVVTSTYTNNQGKKEVRTDKIQKPLVIVNRQLSDVLSNLLRQAQGA